MYNSRRTQKGRTKNCLSLDRQGKGFSRSLKLFRLAQRSQHQPRSGGMLHVKPASAFLDVHRKVITVLAVQAA